MMVHAETSPSIQHLCRGIFVTGTDTGVGKTLMANALLHAYRGRGMRVLGMKPVASGARRTGNELINDDLDQLQRASNVLAPRRLLNPYCFEPAIAPHLAAKLTGVNIDLAVIQQAFNELANLADIIIVEGIGGFRVPLNRTDDTADLASRLALPVVLVVGVRLGCLNHALLTVQAIRAAGLRLGGWIANRIDADMTLGDMNVGALCERIDAPLLADVPFTAVPGALAAAALLDLTTLD